MDYMALWITGVILTLLYCGLGGTILFKFWTLLDAFQKAAIIGFTIEILTKAVFWIIAWDLNTIH